MIKRVLVAGGGTGGHLFPGLAVVEELRRRYPETQILFVGTERGIEARILPERGERLELLRVTPLKGLGPFARLASLARIPKAMTGAAALIRDFQPDLVLGVGGYASGPMLLTAATSGVPSVVLEQNAYVGLTNRWLAPFIDRAYVAFENTISVFGEHKSRVTGNPVRRDFVDFARRAAADPEGFESRATTLLVIGGSQGAQSLNQTVPEALAKTNLPPESLRVVHQTGTAMRDDVEARYATLGIDAEVVTFIDDVARAYANARLVIARAGATTLAELCAIGRAAILIPFPHAADDHQAKNAIALADKGAAVCIRESELTSTGLADTVRELMSSESSRRRMAAAARLHGRPDAAAAIVDDLYEWLGGPPATAQRARSVPNTERNGSGPLGAIGWPKPVYAVSSAGAIGHRPRSRRPLVVDGAVWE